jgi:hypothetical protein
MDQIEITGQVMSPPEFRRTFTGEGVLTVVVKAGPGGPPLHSPSVVTLRLKTPLAEHWKGRLKIGDKVIARGTGGTSGNRAVLLRHRPVLTVRDFTLEPAAATASPV